MNSSIETAPIIDLVTAPIADKDDIKNYTWRDKEYYMLYQRQLYASRLGLKCVCEICGSVTTNGNLQKHIKTKKCQKHLRINQISFKERVERLEKILSHLPADFLDLSIINRQFIVDNLD